MANVRRSSMATCGLLTSSSSIAATGGRPPCGRWASRKAIESPISLPTPTSSSNRSIPCHRSEPCSCGLNYRLTADDFAYITTHSGAKVLCVHPDHLDAVDGVRGQLGGVEHFVCLGSAGGRKGWNEHESAIATAGPGFERPEIAESDLLSLNYTSGTTARPKGVMITHRNEWINVVGTLVHLHLGVDDRYLWTLPMFHANGWTFVWIMTAVGGKHICLPKVEPARVFDLIRKEHVGWLCAAPTVLIALANAPAEVRGDVPRGVQVVTAGAPPAAATIERMEGEFGWEITQVYGLTETSPFLTIC